MKSYNKERAADWNISLMEKKLQLFYRGIPIKRLGFRAYPPHPGAVYQHLFLAKFIF